MYDTIAESSVSEIELLVSRVVGSVSPGMVVVNVVRSLIVMVEGTRAASLASQIMILVMKPVADITEGLVLIASCTI